MFYLWNLDGLQQAYSPGIVRAARVAKIEDHKNSNRNLPQEYKAALAHYQHPTPDVQHEAIVAKDLMSEPVFTVSKETQLDEVASLMKERRYRHLPVINEKNLPIGIISDRDVLSSTIEALQSRKSLRDIPVTEVMTKHLLTAAPEAEISSVVKIMFDERIGSIPVVNRQGEILGIITRSDVLRGILKHGPLTLWV